MSDKKQYFQIGDEVAYSATWLRATGNRVGPMPFLRGLVVKIEPFGLSDLIHVSWFLNGKPYRIESNYHDDGLGRVISRNLVHVKRLAAEAALAE